MSNTSKPSYETCKKAQESLAKDMIKSGMSSEAAAKKSAEIARNADAKRDR